MTDETSVAIADNCIAINPPFEPGTAVSVKKAGVEVVTYDDEAMAIAVSAGGRTLDAEGQSRFFVPAGSYDVSLTGSRQDRPGVHVTHAPHWSQSFDVRGGGRPSSSSALASLVDVDIASPADGDVLVFDGESGLWAPGAPANATGGAGVGDRVFFVADSPLATDESTTVKWAAVQPGWRGSAHAPGTSFGDPNEDGTIPILESGVYAITFNAGFSTTGLALPLSFSLTTFTPVGPYGDLDTVYPAADDSSSPAHKVAATWWIEAPDAVGIDTRVSGNFTRANFNGGLLQIIRIA